MTDKEFEAALPKGVHRSFDRAMARAIRARMQTRKFFYGETIATDEEIIAAIPKR